MTFVVNAASKVFQLLSKQGAFWNEVQRADKVKTKHFGCSAAKQLEFSPDGEQVQYWKHNASGLSCREHKKTISSTWNKS